MVNIRNKHYDAIDCVIYFFKYSLFIAIVFFQELILK